MSIKTKLKPALEHLSKVLEAKADETRDVVKTGRTVHHGDGRRVPENALVLGVTELINPCLVDIQSDGRDFFAEFHSERKTNIA